jgi:hypothetical protein
MSQITLITENYTRTQYLNKECTHEQYYTQYCNDTIIDRVNSFFGKEKLQDAIKEDEHLNNIPIAKWDILASNLYDVSKKMKENGDYLTLAGGVCICKQAAKIICDN